MTDWNAITPGDVFEVDDDGERFLVERVDRNLFVFKTFFDGSYQRTAWVRQLDAGWRVSSSESVAGTYEGALDAAMRRGIEISHGSLKKNPPPSSQ
jgi:hypothetical protein